MRLHIHFGAHKTATTHIQDTLEAGREELLRQGVDYIPRQALRSGAPFPLRPKALPWFDRRVWLRQGAVKDRLLNWLDQYRHAGHTTVLSEENIAGRVSGVLEQGTYPDAERNLGALMALADTCDLQLYFSIREFGELLPSAFAQRMRQHARMGKIMRLEDFERLRRWVMRRPPRWSEFLDRITKVVPASRLTVWRYEDYKSHSHQLLATLCNLNAASIALPELAPPSSTRSPSTEALAKLESMEAGTRLSDAEIECVYAAGGGGDKFQPFSLADRGLLQEAYADDITCIERRYPGVLMSFR